VQALCAEVHMPPNLNAHPPPLRLSPDGCACAVCRAVL
jgi:hypothetical protein